MIRVLAKAVLDDGTAYEADLARPISLALPLRPDDSSVRAWGVDPVRVAPVRRGEWVGRVREGAPVNFSDVTINPHGNGTHTETVGHIAADWEANTVLGLLSPGLFVGILHDATLNVAADGGRVVDLSGLRQNPPPRGVTGLIVRACGPGADDADFSGGDPPYFDAADLAWLAEIGVEHLVTDLPSVDRERDGGALAGHHAYWRYPDRPRRCATITELARLNQPLAPGLYLIGLHALPLAADASPSHPVVYELTPSNPSPE